MTTHEQLRSAERQAYELLPWYVNDTLGGEERELIRRQLLISLTCRKEFERLRRLQQAMQRDDAESVATERAFERLMARIDASAAPRSMRGGNLRWVTSAPYVAQAALLLIFVSGLVWWWFPAPSTAPQSYGTLSTSQPADQGITRLRVVFAPDASELARRELLAEHRLTLVGEPTSSGVYTLVLAESADVRSVVAALKADSRVEFVSTPAAAED